MAQTLDCDIGPRESGMDHLWSGSAGLHGTTAKGAGPGPLALRQRFRLSNWICLFGPLPCGSTKTVGEGPHGIAMIGAPGAGCGAPIQVFLAVLWSRTGPGGIL